MALLQGLGGQHDEAFVGNSDFRIDITTPLGTKHPQHHVFFVRRTSDHDFKVYHVVQGHRVEMLHTRDGGNLNLHRLTAKSDDKFVLHNFAFRFHKGDNPTGSALHNRARVQWAMHHVGNQSTKAKAAKSR